MYCISEDLDQTHIRRDRHLVLFLGSPLNGNKKQDGAETSEPTAIKLNKTPSHPDKTLH